MLSEKLLSETLVSGIELESVPSQHRNPKESSQQQGGESHAPEILDPGLDRDPDLYPSGRGPRFPRRQRREDEGGRFFSGRTS